MARLPIVFGLWKNDLLEEGRTIPTYKQQMQEILVISERTEILRHSFCFVQDLT